MFGIKIPKSVQEAYDMYKETNTSDWKYATRKDMNNCKE